MQVNKPEDLQVRTQDLSLCVIRFMGVHAAWSVVKQTKTLVIEQRPSRVLNLGPDVP
jgi:hypothetical protein